MQVKFLNIAEPRILGNRIAEISQVDFERTAAKEQVIGAMDPRAVFVLAAKIVFLGIPD